MSSGACFFNKISGAVDEGRTQEPDHAHWVHPSGPGGELAAHDLVRRDDCVPGPLHLLQRAPLGADVVIELLEGLERLRVVT